MKMLIFVLVLILSFPTTASAAIVFDGNYDNGYMKGCLYADLPEYSTPKVTAVHSANAELKLSFCPSLESFPYDLIAKVVDDGDFAAVYGEYFESEVASVDQTALHNSDRTRELEILGYDILVKDEQISFTDHKPKAVTKNIEDGEIDEYTSCVAMYKALGKYQYDCKLDYKPDKSLTLENSPIATKLNLIYNRGNNLDVSQGYTNVLITRSNSNFYGDTIAADLDVHTKNDNTPTSLAKFCVNLKKLMVLYGEPILTKQEETQLLQIYGKKLPYYVANSQDLKDNEDVLDAVKYLIAKGILDPDKETPYDFSGYLTLEDMLTMLAAVKDVNSRFTFKDVAITVDQELLDLGYFETQLNGFMSPIQDIEPAIGASSYYTYVLKPTFDATSFTLLTKSGKAVVSDIDSLFFYEKQDENGYIFKIHTNTKLIKDYLHTGNYFKLKSDTGKVFYLKYGGGYYTLTKKSKKATRKAFDDKFADTSIYVDKERKEAYLQSQKSPSKLSPASTSIPIKFSLPYDTWISDIGNLRFKKKVTDTDTSAVDLTSLRLNTKFTIPDTEYVFERDSVETNGYMYFTVTGCKDLADFQAHLVHDKSTSRYNEYQTFCQSDESLLVNFDYLQDVGLANRYIELDNEVILLTTNTNNIYLCPKQRWIVVGNVIYDMPENSLMYYKKDERLFVDYRAATGWSSDYYVFQDDNGTMTLTAPRKANKARQTTRQITTPFISHTLRTQVVDDSILLSSTYPLANYFVYCGSEAAGSTSGDTDYLFVFKLKCDDSSYTDDSVARRLLREYVGFEAPELWLVYAYQLHRNKPKANPPGIKYSNEYGYYYTPQKAGNDYIKNYYETCLLPDGKSIKGTSAKYKSTSDIVLPFVVGETKTIYDINFNMFKIKDQTLPYGSAPYAYAYKNLMTDSRPITDTNYNKKKYVINWLPSGKSTNDMTEYGYANEFEITMAPTAVISGLVSLSPLDYTNIADTSYNVYVGTMKATLVKPAEQELHFSDGKYPYKLTLRNTLIGYIHENDISSFNILRSTANGYVLGLPSQDGLTALDEDRSASASSPVLGKGKSLYGFDWERFKFKNLVENADDLVTIATIALLNFIPRIAMFLFMCLIGLSLITNIKIWQIFCDKIFDIYKLFTLGRQDVHTINTNSLFWTSIVALGVFGLFMDGTIINIIAWFTRFGAAILSR